jgi:hypothetical protein
MASNQSLAWFLPQCHEPPVANYGVRDERNTTSPHPIVRLAIGDIFIVSLVLVRAYTSGGVRNFIHFAMSSAITNYIKLESCFERIGDQIGNLNTDNWAAAQNTGDVLVPSGTAGDVKITSVDHSHGAQMGNLAVGEGGRLKIKRVAAAGADAAGDLEIRFLEIMEI